MANLTDPITALPGVGPTKAKQFAALNIRTVQDLILHFPRGYEDRTKILTISQLEADKPACFRATVMGTPRISRIRKGLELIRVQVADATGRLTLTFFNQKYTAGQLQYGETYIFYGTLNGDFGGYGMTSPAFEKPDSPPEKTRRILPRYPLTAGLSNAFVIRTVEQALALYDPPGEILPEEIRREYGILPAEQAYFAIHQPTSLPEAEQAKKRLIFEEFFVFSAGLSLLRAQRSAVPCPAYRITDPEPFYRALPFTLTGAQKRAVEDVIADFRRGTPMNRLIQGDVGSGKTAVAAAAAYLAAKNGRQVAMMAPTEILSEQHARSLSAMLEPLGIRICLLTGAMTEKQKKNAREAISAGEADVVVGTHALLSQTTVFRDLGLVITDEQHRFGVDQRAKLQGKGDHPHTLVMSATPIPRTMTLLMYGDLEVSVLDELPPGRQKVDTFLVSEGYRARVNAFIRKQVASGGQCFIVCPAVEENQELDIKAVETWAETLQKTVFPDLRIALLHGQMKGAEKEAVMSAFARKEADILVATTVIEVGVDVPNATLMVVEDADRFGLSQLHQLRGRVGRGKEKSYCILFSDNKNPEVRRRMETLCRTNDGFRIAEEDLRLRGPGDLLGSRQSGLPVFKVADLNCDLKTLQLAQQAASRWIDTRGTEDTPEGRCLRERIGELFARAKGTMN